MSEINYMDLKEFRDAGYLQEVNRQFLHPLGLALVWDEDEDGVATIKGVWDDREDPEGWIFSPSDTGPDEARKADFVAAELAKRAGNRLRTLGWIVQPVDDGGMVEPKWQRIVMTDSWEAAATALDAEVTRLKSERDCYELALQKIVDGRIGMYTIADEALRAGKQFRYRGVAK